MPTIEVELTYRKSTKNKHVYGDDPETSPPVQSLYIEKSYLPTPAPRIITVNVNWEK